MNGAPQELGLTGAEAAARLVRDGPNELPSSKPRSLWSIAWEIVREPMFLLLIGASTIYLVLGDIREALVLFASVFVIMGITFHQERKTERALEALRELSSPCSRVLRDGEWSLIAGRDIVVDDVVLIKEGDRVPADAVLLSAGTVTTDESLLTGESFPVRKRAGAGLPDAARPGGDDLPFVYSGTMVTRGQGVARVTATASQTELGKIGRALQLLVPETSPLQRESRRAVLLFGTLGLALCVVVTVVYGVKRGDWLNAILAGITLAMANLPEEMPVVLTVFLALGAWRISQRGVLTRRAAAIETLGSTTVLCVDKTGTLTQNRMAVQRTWTSFDGPDPGASEGARALDLLEFSVLASDLEPFDPMEKAYHELARKRAPEMVAKHATWTMLRAYPLSPEQLSMAQVWERPDGEVRVVAAKGAPEAILDLCALEGARRATVLAQVAAMAEEGLRVLAVAKGTLSAAHANAGRWPASQAELRLQLVGLTGLADPIRPGVPKALAECYAAGIRTVMITGDYPGTARAIARQIGLAHPESVLVGAELGALSPAQLQERVARVDVFARVAPEQKLRLVEALKANGEIVAMTGDGVNDAPALKAAHIGVAMGKRGSDVAREAGSLVLLDDDFASLVEAVKLGRRIFDNIQKAMCYIVAVHVPTAGMALLPLLFGWPLVFYPVHIVFLEFVIDPACSIAFEAEPPESDLMRRPPRAPTSRLFDGWMLAISIAQGTSVLIAVALLYAWALSAGTPEPQARAMAFASVVLGNVGLILVNRSRREMVFKTLRRPNPALGWIVAAAIVGLGFALYAEPLSEIFRFSALTGDQLLLSAIAATLGLALPETGKWLRAYPTRLRNV